MAAAAREDGTLGQAGGHWFHFQVSDQLSLSPGMNNPSAVLRCRRGCGGAAGAAGTVPAPLSTGRL